MNCTMTDTFPCIRQSSRPTGLANPRKSNLSLATPNASIPDSELGTVEVIDTATFQIIRRFHVGPFPELTPSWDLKRLYVDVSASSTLAVIDPKMERPTEQLLCDR